MAVLIGSARSSYGNTSPGDQHSGLEVSTQNWYLHSKGWYVLRAKDAAAREKAMEAAEAPVKEARYVQIVNGNCYVRTAPNTDGKKLGVAHRGDILDYQGVQSADGWTEIDAPDDELSEDAAYAQAGKILLGVSE